MKKEKKNMPPVMPYPAEHTIETDPQGSYTGVTEKWMEKPVQDADDL